MPDSPCRSTRRLSSALRATLPLVALFAFVLSAVRLSAQDILPRAAAIEVRARFVSDLDTLQHKFLALAEAIPAEKYSWRPAPGVRSIGEAFMHVASEYYLFTPMAYGATPSPVIKRAQGEMEKFEAMSTKADVMKHLTESFAFTRKAVTGLDEEKITGTQKLFGGDRTIIETSFIMSADLHEHLGQMIAYARMNGVKPPWSK
ncbi:MAG: DinB family protein [Gemmatimonadota bacterium]